VSLFATEKLPSPLVIDGIVSNEYSTRTLVVLRPDQASGYQKLAWRTAHGALSMSEQSGWRGAPFLWARGAGQTEIAHGLPGDNLTLLFHFPAGTRKGRFTPNWSVSRVCPRLSRWIVRLTTFWASGSSIDRD
jgi:hypothetical protein